MALPKDKQTDTVFGDIEGLSSLKHWGEPPTEPPHPAVWVDCGWGRLLFGQTFLSAAALAEALLKERENERDIAFYVREPHVVLAQAPQALFLDPSNTFRLELKSKDTDTSAGDIEVVEAVEGDEAEINRLYASRGMVPLRQGYLVEQPERDAVSVLVVRDETRRNGLEGVVMGVDHLRAFDDPDNGASLWALAVDPQARRPGIGQALVIALADRFAERGRSFMDLSVMHNNEQAIALYDKLGFRQVPVYCVKTRTTINQNLFIGPPPEERLNIYAKLIVDEARRRGISVEIDDAEAGMFTLSHGARSVSCRESLSDRTTAIAMSRCDDKALTRRILERAGLRVTEQADIADEEEAVTFLEKHKRIVVKPARGEQGHGVRVDLTAPDAVRAAYRAAAAICDRVIAEKFVAGEDLRVIVIDGEVVAAAVRRPAAVMGDGTHAIIELIDKQSRRRAAATGGESRIPLDTETERCVRASGHNMTDVLPCGETLRVRKTANLHTGGTIHDVTDDLHPELAAACLAAADALDIPVVGLDLIVEAVNRPDYTLIEANERPGLANHEPRPTAERFVDFLFPETRADLLPGRVSRR